MQTRAFAMVYYDLNFQIGKTPNKTVIGKNRVEWHPPLQLLGLVCPPPVIRVQWHPPSKSTANLTTANTLKVLS